MIFILTKMHIIIGLRTYQFLKILMRILTLIYYFKELVKENYEI